MSVINWERKKEKKIHLSNQRVMHSLKMNLKKVNLYNDEHRTIHNINRVMQKI
jgi:hypothetical protein